MKKLLVIFLFLNYCVVYAQWQDFTPEMKSYELRELLFFRNLTFNSQEKDFSWFSGKKMMPLFCQIEDKIEKNTRLPVKLRVGSLNYVNYLENKYNNVYFYPSN